MLEWSMPVSPCMRLHSLMPRASPFSPDCSVRAEPEWGVLGKRLGKAMAAVAKAVKALPMEVRLVGFWVCRLILLRH